MATPTQNITKALKAYNPEDMGALERAIEATLPNGSNLSHAQLHGAALAMKTTNRNLFAKEGYMTDRGFMESASAELADFNDAMLRAGKGLPQWASRLIVDKEIRARLNCESERDVVVEVTLRFDGQGREWREAFDRLKLFVDAGLMTLADVLADIGTGPKPYATAYGVVRYSEAKEKKNSAGVVIVTQEAAWREFCSKYSAEQRAEKRAKIAIARKIWRPTVEQRSRWQSEHEATVREASEDPAKYVTASESVVERQSPEQTARNRSALRSDADLHSEEPFGMPPKAKPAAPSAAEIIIPANADSVIEGTSRDITDEGPELFADTDADSDGEAEALATEEPTSTGSAAYLEGMPADVVALYHAVTASAREHADKGSTYDEKKRKWIFTMLQMDLCKGANKRESDERRRSVIHFLTGFERWPDIPDCMLYAIKEVFLKPTKGPGDQFPRPCAEAHRLAAIIWSRHHVPEA